MDTKTKILFPVFAILFVAVLCLLYLNYSKSTPTGLPTPTAAPTVLQTPTTIPTSSNSLKTYSNSKYGLSFSYPAGTKIFGDLNSPAFSISQNNQVASISFIKAGTNKSIDETFMELLSSSDPQSVSKYLTFSDYSDCATCRKIVQDSEYFKQQPGGFNNVLSNLPTLYIVRFQYPDNSQPLVDQILSTLKFTNTPKSTTDWKTYENKEYGFSFKYPAYLTKSTLLAQNNFADDQQFTSSDYQTEDTAENRIVTKGLNLYLNYDNVNTCNTTSDITKQDLVKQAYSNYQSQVYYTSWEGMVFHGADISIKNNCLHLGFQYGNNYTKEQVKDIFTQILSTFKFQ